MSNRKEIIQKMGTVIESLPNTHFRVRLDDGGEVMAHLAGKMRMHRIKVLLGDSVTIEMSSPDDRRGRIVYRQK